MNPDSYYNLIFKRRVLRKAKEMNLSPDAIEALEHTDGTRWFKGYMKPGPTVEEALAEWIVAYEAEQSRRIKPHSPNCLSRAWNRMVESIRKNILLKNHEFRNAYAPLQEHGHR